jgi:hypothetical protein
VLPRFLEIAVLLGAIVVVLLSAFWPSKRGSPQSLTRSIGSIIGAVIILVATVCQPMPLWIAVGVIGMSVLALLSSADRVLRVWHASRK